MAIVEVNNSTVNKIDSSRRYKMTGWPLVIFFVGLVITIFLFFIKYSADQAKTLSDFEHVVQVRISSLHKELAELNDSVHAIRSYISRDPTDHNLSHDLNYFIKHILDDETHVRAVAWVLPNSSDGYNALQSASQIPAADNCDATTNASTSQAYRLCSLVSFEHGEALLANGLVNNPELITALTQALQTGEMAVSGPSAAGQKQHRFFVYPVSHNQPGDMNVKAGNVKAGADTNQGFLIIENYIPDLVEMGLDLYTEDGGGVDIYLVDLFADGNKHILHYHPSRLREKSLEQTVIQIQDLNAPLVSATAFHYGGQNWQLIFVAVPAVFNLMPSMHSIVVLLAGILLCSLLAAFQANIDDKKQFAEQQVFKRTQELAESNSSLEQAVRSRQRIAKEIQYDLLVKQTFNAVLETAMSRLSLNEKLEKILQLILHAEWLSIETQGSIFLVEQGQERLTLTVQNGLEKPLLAACANISFGQCLCGKAAATQEIVFSNCVGHQHDITFPGMKQHGHYCIPILSNQETLGVLNLYVEHNHQTNESEQHNLKMIANILSGIIERDIIEEIVKKTLKDLDNQVNALNEHAIVSVLDKQQRITSINNKYCKIAGFSEEELIGVHCCTGLSDDQSEEFCVNLLNTINQGEIWKGETCNRSKDSNPYWTMTTIVPFKVENEIYKFVVISTDITEQKLAEKILHTKHAEIQKAHRELDFQKQALDEHAIVSITDVRGDITYANDKFTEISQYSREELIGENHRILKSGLHSDEIYRDMWRTIAQGKPWKGEVSNRKKDGSFYWVAATIVPFLNNKGKPYKYIAIRVDITEQKDNEQQLLVRNKEIEQAHMELEKSQNMMLHAEKLASVGQLASGIAHEINTPIQFVGDNTRFLQESFEDLIGLVAVYEEMGNAANGGKALPELVAKARALSEEVEVDYLAEEVPNAISQSLEGVKRISKIVRSMKDFSHPGTDSLENIDLNNAIDSTINVSRNEWKYIAEMVTEFDARLTSVPCYPGELNQVILNIIVNAAHAIKDSRNETDPLGKITISTELTDDDVEIRITDSGCGIPEEVRKHIFDPFFTTKGVGKGTGQGLAIAHAVIVDKHKGKVSVESEPGKGTTLIIRLPMSAVVDNSEMDKHEEILSMTGVQ